MRRIEIYERWFIKIYQLENIGLADLPIYYDSRFENNYVECFKELKSKLRSNELIRMADIITEIIMEDQDIDDPVKRKGDLQIIDFKKKEFKALYRNFCVNVNELSYSTSNMLIAFLNNDSNIETFRPSIKAFIKNCIVLGKIGVIKPILNIINKKIKDRGIILNNSKKITDIKNYMMYSYLALLNEYKNICTDLNLEYIPRTLSSSPKCDPFLNYDEFFRYNQYLDVFDIFNEVVVAKDILIRFLKIYHVLEYLCYRIELVKIEKDTTKKTYIRAVLKLASKNDEKSLVTKNMQLILNDYKSKPEFTKIITTISNGPAIKSFLKNYYNLTDYSNQLGTVSQLIYQLRCSIVHAKESELHFTLSNSEDYKDIVGLIKELIYFLEHIIINSLSTKKDVIYYSKDCIPLYY